MSIDEGEEIGPGNSHRRPLRARARQPHGDQVTTFDEGVNHSRGDTKDGRRIPNPVQLRLKHERGSGLWRAFHFTTRDRGALGWADCPVGEPRGRRS